MRGKDGRNKRAGAQVTRLARDCILQVFVQVRLEDLVHLALQIVKKANHFDVFLGVAGLEEKANSRDVGIGIPGAGVFGQQGSLIGSRGLWPA